MEQQADIHLHLPPNARTAPCSGHDLMHVFSKLPLDVNFIGHTSNIGWKEFQRAKPVIIDLGLYLKKADVFWMPQCWTVPTTFKLLTDNKPSVSKH